MSWSATCEICIRRVVMLMAGVVLLASTATTVAETVVRDHRGPKGAPSGGVTVTGECSKANPCGPTRRPRGTAPQTQPSDLSGATVRDHRSIPCLGNLC
jgi:hypothetical protein